MSSRYSANQYEGAFRSHRLQNWCQAKPSKQRPAAHRGHTTIISNDRGHLLPGVVKRGSAWPDFRGTWDLPARIPAQHINPTARSQEGLHRLRSWGLQPQRSGSFQPHGGSKGTECLQEAAEQSSDGPPSQRSVCENDGVLSGKPGSPSESQAAGPGPGAEAEEELQQQQIHGSTELQALDSAKQQ
ncbi:protein Flattop [Salarias fasciatus]|uniref:protein Flattop n=1 Tax=Salarias fasciatus TaxID=181472 RepID=UPI001176B5D1|nr:protein Flattop [Salarias fasciatus]